LKVPDTTGYISRQDDRRDDRIIVYCKGTGLYMFDISFPHNLMA